jgi:hypothetical protein
VERQGCVVIAVRVRLGYSDGGPGELRCTGGHGRERRVMATIKDWEKAGAPVEGYIVPPGESLESPSFASSRGLAWTASTGGLIDAIVLPSRSISPLSDNL